MLLYKSDFTMFLGGWRSCHITEGSRASHAATVHTPEHRGDNSLRLQFHFLSLGQKYILWQIMQALCYQKHHSSRSLMLAKIWQGHVPLGREQVLTLCIRIVFCWFIFPSINQNHLPCYCLKTEGIILFFYLKISWAFLVLILHFYNIFLAHPTVPHFD